MDWDGEVARLRDAQDWDAALKGLRQMLLLFFSVMTPCIILILSYMMCSPNVKTRLDPCLTAVSWIRIWCVRPGECPFLLGFIAPGVWYGRLSQRTMYHMEVFFLGAINLTALRCSYDSTLCIAGLGKNIAVWLYHCADETITCTIRREHQVTHPVDRSLAHRYPFATELLETSSVEVPDYYVKPFHAYSDGNLCWEAAWEQHLASKAVG